MNRGRDRLADQPGDSIVKALDRLIREANAAVDRAAEGADPAALNEHLERVAVKVNALRIDDARVRLVRSSFIEWLEAGIVVSDREASREEFEAWRQTKTPVRTREV